MPVHPIDLKFWESVLWGAGTPDPKILKRLNDLAVANAAYRYAKNVVSCFSTTTGPFDF